MTVSILEQLRDQAIYVKDLERMILYPFEGKNVTEAVLQKTRDAFARSAMDNDRLQSQYYDWLEELPLQYRVVIRLYYFLGFHQEEVIEYTGISKCDWFKINYEILKSLEVE